MRLPVMVVGVEGDTVVAEATKIFPWDHFITSEGVRLAVEAFRRAEWPNIKRFLSKDYGIDLPEGLEPCWVEPGKAIFWQEQRLRMPETRTDDQGREYREMVEHTMGYLPTSPFPANNASQIAGRLRKGDRLRPPDQVVVEAEAPDSLEESAQPANEPTFLCDRHGIGNRRVLKSWKSYMQHCQFYKEVPEIEPPPDVLARAALHEYFCYFHGKGFISQAGATHHRTSELKKPGRSFHPSVEEMRVVKEAVNA